MIGAILTLGGCTGKEKSGPADEAFKTLKKEPLKQITEEVILSLKDEDLEQAIFDNLELTMKSDSRQLNEKVKALTAGQRAIYVTWIVEAEVNDGGFSKFYSTSLELADMSEESFKTIGATGFAELMSNANLLYSKTKDNPKSSGVNPFLNLDEQFYKLYETESLDLLKVKYIRANTGEFVAKVNQ